MFCRTKSAIKCSYVDILDEPVHEKTNNLGSDQIRHTNRPVQSQKMVRGWKFLI